MIKRILLGIIGKRIGHYSVSIGFITSLAFVTHGNVLAFLMITLGTTAVNLGLMDVGK